VLSDPDKRQTYDLEGEEGLENLKRMEEHKHSGPESILEQLFGMSTGGKRKGQDYRMDYAVRLEDLLVEL